MVALAVTGSAQAVEFDEKLKAPMMKSQAALHSQAQAYAARFVACAMPHRSSSSRIPRWRARQFDVVWQIQRAIDERKPLGELADAGIVAARRWQLV